MTRLAGRRHEAAVAQAHHCFYCGLPMWDSDPKGFATRYRLTTAQMALLQCTAEHVVARCDGGRDTRDNIVAAHAFCNRLRHSRHQPLTSEDYRELVRGRVRRGRWLAAQFPQIVTTSTDARSA